jgi:diaminohydroxyphosphoribosylaminopyrimidine deaminase/5-amino-6-(5-phosphoribosylamino)uracil reductase
LAPRIGSFREREAADNVFPSIGHPGPFGKAMRRRRKPRRFSLEARNPVKVRQVSMSDPDQYWMRRALELAERGRGYVEPNPLVGAVLVRDGQLVGEGWHQRFGEPHAEINAIAAAVGGARGATLYVTLEPCCHHGRTPPCTDAVIRAGIVRVVAAMEDPFPPVAGKGAAALRSSGIAVDLGVCEAEARQLNAPYLTLLEKGRPYAHAKWAMTLDGKIATRTRDSKWISNEASRRLVHQLRGRMDGILVGIGTVLADDPRLTVRPPGPRTPTRVVLDSGGRIPLESQLVRTAREVPTILVTTTAIAPTKQAELTALGCQVEVVAGAGRLDLSAVLNRLGQRRFTNILVEGGATVLGSLLDAGLIDAVHVFIAPILAGGDNALSALGGVGVDKIAGALRLTGVDVRIVDGDVYVHGHR